MPVCTPFKIPRGSPAQEYILDIDIQDIWNPLSSCTHTVPGTMLIFEFCTFVQSVHEQCITWCHSGASMAPALSSVNSTNHKAGMYV